jgi:hypothetical protein
LTTSRPAPRRLVPLQPLQHQHRSIDDTDVSARCWPGDTAGAQFAHDFAVL